MKRKIICIGDIHGSNKWFDIVSKESNDTDLFVFIGDYFDRFEEHTPRQMWDNFLKILKFKEVFGEDKVKLLIGNHDLHYYNAHYRCSGFNEELYDLINKDIIDLIDSNTLEISYYENNLLFSHAGFTKTWCDDYKIDLSVIKNNELQYYLIDNPDLFRFIWKGINTNGYGDNIFQGPLWVRPDSLKGDRIDEDIYQIVGHTHTNIKLERNCWFIDSLEYNEYLEIITNDYSKEFIIKKI